MTVYETKTFYSNVFNAINKKKHDSKNIVSLFVKGDLMQF